MIIECRNAKKRFDKPSSSASAKSNNKNLIWLDNHCNGHRQIFKENLQPNRRFGVETMLVSTVSIIYNHYCEGGFVENIIIIAILAVIVGLASYYIYKAKKSGKKCIGCPHSCSCDSSKCGSCSCCSSNEN